jgi:hypothetical protein
VIFGFSGFGFGSGISPNARADVMVNAASKKPAHIMVFI